MGPGYWLLRQMILSPAGHAPAGQTEFGLQPFQNHFVPHKSGAGREAPI